MQQFKEIKLENYDNEKLKEIGKSQGIFNYRYGDSDNEVYDSDEDSERTIPENKENTYNIINKYFTAKENLPKFLEKENKDKTLSIRPQGFANKEVNSTEKLFWRVFRDIFLFKKIFSNFTFSKTHGYDRLFGVSPILQKFSNGTSIVLDKLKSGGYLAIDKGPQNGLYQIFKQIDKDTAENREFYKILFTTNKDWFLFYIKVVDQILSSSNLFALEQFFKYFGIQKETIQNYFKEMDEYGRTNKYKIKSLKDFQLYIYLKSLSIEIIHVDINILNLFDVSVKLKDLIEIDLALSNIANSEDIASQFTNEQLNSSIIQLLSPLLDVKLFESNLPKKDTDNNNAQLFELRTDYSSIVTRYYIEEINASKQNNPITNNSNKYHKLKLNIYNIFERINLIQKQKSIFYYLLFKDSETIRKIIQDNNTSDGIETMLGWVFSSDNLQLIAHLTNFLSYSDWSTTELYYPMAQTKSTIVLDYLFYNHQEIFFKENNDIYILIEDINILQHYEQLMNSLSRKLSINFKRYRQNNFNANNSGIIERLIRAASFPSIYTVNDSSQEEKTEFLVSIFVSKDIKRLANIDYMVLLKFLTIYQFTQLNLDIVFQHYTGGILIFSSWLKENGKVTVLSDNYPTYHISITLGDGSEKKEFLFLTSTFSYLRMLYSCKHYDDIISIIKTFSIKQVIHSISSLVCITNISHVFIKTILREFAMNSDEAFKSKFYKILKNIIVSGNLPVLKYIAINYSELFLANILTISNFSISNDSLDIFKFLLNFINITQDDCDKVIYQSNRRGRLIYKYLDIKKNK
ncbi:hypothetical protein DICPUDRAFT_78073 [Dictyostelium purpureum]|uniref:Uncharacterized protein n=1 Tax=Dictyostelium purpureum TaxID=5786 RepID=F0ZIH0_DICPU|nr:uncharacterized protein DICPUDRAFT_78073 [Dictyostelium purpureum]EGC36279.1 hypothetical protein DICPUDRAFT_78073 [Dictyostelium purpureum]|eukprot:XP_003287225.1 hypothetical protein DICPUDRAFT_78073 [Dictyostelium purpureum]